MAHFEGIDKKIHPEKTTQKCENINIINYSL